MEGIEGRRCGLHTGRRAVGEEGRRCGLQGRCEGGGARRAAPRWVRGSEEGGAEGTRCCNHGRQRGGMAENQAEGPIGLQVRRDG
jgi:hypothetical protein